jgi:hypothetical protein
MMEQLPDPHISLNSELREIVEDWDPDVEEPELLVQRIRKVFEDRQAPWSIRTMSTYMTSIRRLGTFSGKFINPEQIHELRRRSRAQGPDGFAMETFEQEAEAFDKELADYENLSYNNRSTVLTPFQQALTHTAFYRDHIFANWNLDVLEKGGHQKLLQVSQEVKNAQLNAIILIPQPNLFQQTLLRGYSATKRVNSGLLLVCVAGDDQARFIFTLKISKKTRK